MAPYADFGPDPSAWKRIRTTFGVVERKLRRYPPEQQLAIIDWIVGELFDIRSRVGARLAEEWMKSSSRKGVY